MGTSKFPEVGEEYEQIGGQGTNVGSHIVIGTILKVIYANPSQNAVTFDRCPCGRKDGGCTWTWDRGYNEYFRFRPPVTLEERRKAHTLPSPEDVMDFFKNQALDRARGNLIGTLDAIVKGKMRQFIATLDAVVKDAEHR